MLGPDELRESLEGRDITVEVNVFGAKDREVLREGLLDFNRDIQHVLRIAIVKVIERQLIWGLCLVRFSSFDSVLLDVFAPTFDLPVV